MIPSASPLIERTFGPKLNLKEANLIAWGLFFALLAPSVYRGIEMQRDPGRHTPDVDFVNFYSMGRILNEYPADALYRTEVQDRVRNLIHPLAAGSYAPLPYPPMVGMFFQPFARLQFWPAYLCWLSITLFLYVGSLVAVGARLFPGIPLKVSLIVCIGLSYFPFLIETLASGQISALGFFAFSMAFLLEDAGHPFLSGLTLSLCSYKPTLLLLFLPMMAVTRRYKNLAGLMAGATTMFLFTVAVYGIRLWDAWVKLFLHFGGVSAGVHTNSILDLPKYVDLLAFSALLPYGRSGPALTLLGICAAGAIFLVVDAWRKGGNAAETRRLVWATTLVWTLLLNVYAPIWDTILAVLSGVLSVQALKTVPAHLLRRCLGCLWTLTFLVSWVATATAARFQIQPMTLLLAVIGVLQIAALRWLVRTRSEKPVVVRATGG